jgi:hypothetical protein
MDIKYAFVFFLHVLHENLFKNLEIFNSISFPMFTILLLFAHVTKGTSILKYANG